ncbi:MAG: MarR family transcriptional regulator [Chloroflexi bacterium]|nr:MarR family transcriptional regulator [Chloroflexota bacterium]
MDDSLLTTLEQNLRTFFGDRDVDLDAQAVVYTLSHAGRDVILTMESAVLRPRGLTYAGFVLLMSVWISGPLETRALAAVQRVTKGAIVSSVNQLERLGLVGRIRSQIDRRLVSVELTGEGRALIEEVQREWHEMEREMSNVLSQTERRQFVEVLRKITARAQTIRKRNQARKSNAPKDAAVA